MSAAAAHMDGVSLGDQKPCLTQRATQERVEAIAVELESVLILPTCGNLEILFLPLR